MKKIALLFLLAGASCLAIAAESTIDSSKAAFHVGETVMVCGSIKEVTDFKKGTYLNFGAKYPKQHISVTIWNDQKINFLDRFGSLQVFENRRACARGEITQHKNSLQIIIKNPQFLRLMK